MGMSAAEAAPIPNIALTANATEAMNFERMEVSSPGS
jgi:hypothetical protein